MLHSSRRPPKTDADRHSWYKPAPASPKVPPKPVLEQAPTSRAASSARHQADAARHHHVSDSSRYPQAQKPTRPVQQLQQLQQAHHQLSSQPHHQLQQQHGSQRTSYQQTPQRPDRQPHQQHRKAQSLGSQQPGPVQGRPLIFAAMATTEPDPPVAEAEHGQIDMDELDVTAPGLRAMINVDAGNDKLQPVQTELNSAFVDGYPTPKSPSPPLPPEKNEQPTYPLTTKQLQMHAQMQPWPAEAPSVEQVRMQQQQPAVEVQVPRERKLSRTKGHVERVREAESAHSDAVVKPPLTAQMEAPANATSAYRSRPLPPSPVGGDEEASPPPPPPHSYSLPQQPPHMARANISPPQLGSPIQLQNQPPRPPPHARPRRQSRDGVKPLTGRQLEKLANRQILGTPGLQRNGAEEPARVVRGPLPTPPSAPVSPPTAPAPAEQRSSTRVRTTSRHRRESQHVPQPVQPVQPVKPPTPVSADEGPPRARRMSRSSSDRPRRAEDVDDTPRIIQAVPPVQPPTPISPEEYVCARSQRRSARPEKTARPVAMEPESLGSESEEVQVEKEPTWYPLARHMTDPELLAGLLPYLSFYDWSSVSAVSKEIRRKLSGDRVLCEMVLERYLRTVGYARWAWPEPDPLTLSLEDLNAYMRGVSMPTHQYARLATFYIQSRDKSQYEFMQELAASCRAYTRIVLRLRAQAEADAAANPDSRPTDAANGATSPQRGGRSPSVQSGPRGYISRSTSRGPSPTPTSYAYGAGAVSRPMSGSHNFRSPLFRLRRAPLLQVFVPSPEGEWLSDKSVEECEKELYRAGVLHLMRAGDVVWDTAVGDEGNVGRMVWDGSYLLDLDYTYSRTGDLPQYLPTLAFPPSYFHRVIRTMGNGNPICHIDISPWADEIHHNLQLLQDRVKTDTPQGGQHTVVRWVNRSSFTIRPPPGSTSIKISVPNSAGPGPSPNGSWLVDPGWYGTVVVEAEGTNEGLADLQVRCRGAFPPRAVGASANPSRDVGREERKTVFRILREKSRPGEIWIRTVRDKERLL
ncbi:hypothetical protein CERSUDRAFT_84779 [Gelatoporia subvermispora B]|uniref:F-box domain-containing protein n=1 Tax=Ceriporiopsis subvermispora (strain B) TaxID=914234 RepID=M2RDS1_CERS8|nr:hypothetical protein CERSUDRAFT_84779 [Gelatoporia subvermispora B]